MTAEKAGCLDSGDVSKRLHFIVWDGFIGSRPTYDEDRLFHLHHGDSPNVLLVATHTMSASLADEILSWLEAVHDNWLD